MNFFIHMVTCHKEHIEHILMQQDHPTLQPWEGFRATQLSCGQHVLYYHYHRSQGNTMQDIINAFNGSLLHNDVKVIRFYNDIKYKITLTHPCKCLDCILHFLCSYIILYMFFGGHLCTFTHSAINCVTLKCDNFLFDI